MRKTQEEKINGGNMKITISSVTKLRIENVNHLDPITVVLEDIAQREGKIIIECYGKAWSAFWGGMGNRTISKFFQSCGNQYLIGYLSPGLHSIVSDYDNLDSWLKSGLKKMREEKELDRDEARDLWLEIELYCENTEHFLHTQTGNDMATKCFGEEWWHDLPTRENHEYLYLSRIVDEVKRALEMYEK